MMLSNITDFFLVLQYAVCNNHKVIKIYPKTLKWNPTILKNMTDFNHLLCLNHMLYALCLSYHSKTEVVLFACLLTG